MAWVGERGHSPPGSTVAVGPCSGRPKALETPGGHSGEPEATGLHRSAVQPVVSSRAEAVDAEDAEVAVALPARVDRRGPRSLRQPARTSDEKAPMGRFLELDHGSVNDLRRLRDLGLRQSPRRQWPLRGHRLGREETPSRSAWQSSPTVACSAP